MPVLRLLSKEPLASTPGTEAGAPGSCVSTGTRANEVEIAARGQVQDKFRQRTVPLGAEWASSRRSAHSDQAVECGLCRMRTRHLWIWEVAR